MLIGFDDEPLWSQGRRGRLDGRRGGVDRPDAEHSRLHIRSIAAGRGGEDRRGSSRSQEAARTARWPGVDDVLTGQRVRDRPGIERLSYARTGDGVVFGAEPRTAPAHSAVPAGGQGMAMLLERTA
ncbi:hypothetical protein [Streptomyces sp. TE12347]